jgi:hypothetical protein
MTRHIERRTGGVRGRGRDGMEIMEGSGAPAYPVQMTLSPLESTTINNLFVMELMA